MDAEEWSQMFSRPERDRDVMSLWHRLQSGDDYHADALRRLIDDSWRRCMEAAVDPTGSGAPPPIADNSLYSLRQKHGDLLNASTPVMALAREFLAETGTIMVLTDQSGTILSLEGDARTRDAASNMNMLPGGSWSETSSGTNAIGTALAVGHPVQIHSAEHFCEGVKRWTCSATVIVDPYDSSVLGALDVSGLQHTYSRQSLALVVATASKIQNRLARQEMELRFRLLERCMQRMGGAGTDGVIVFDRRGRPIKANERAQAALAAVSGGRVTDLGAISLGQSEAGGLPAGMRAWLREEWLEPILELGERIGTLLVIPMPSRWIAPRGPACAPRVQAVAEVDAFARIVGRDPALVEAVERARRLARANVPVLLLGETGVGKEVFARGIHDCGADPKAPFVALNCGGLSRELLASELFGYAEGAFTGARRGGMMGKLEAANGGTLFLDELGEMPLDLQPHLLRVLEGGEIYRIGENTPRQVRFRLIAATNRDLRAEVAEGRFRMDLFYRVAVTSVRIPALRDRRGDVELLARSLLDQLAEEHGRVAPVLTPPVLARLVGHAWPGNVRELRNVLEGMLLTAADGAVLDETCLPPELTAALELPPQAAFAAEESDGRRLELAERGAIVEAIETCGGNMTAVARNLGIAKSTLYLKLKKFGLDARVESVRYRSGSEFRMRQ